MPWRFLLFTIAALTGLFVAFTILIPMGGIDQSTGLYVWVKFYREGMRTPLFTGCLTLGSFLLTLKATILLRIKEIYDSPAYEEDWELYQAQLVAAGKKAPSFYQPLRNLGVGLLVNVFLAIICSIAQMTLGFSSHVWAVAICVTLAAVTLMTLLYLWWRIASNLIRWFSVIERKRLDEKARAPK